MKVPHSVVGRTNPSSQGLAYISSAGASPAAFGAGLGDALQQTGARVSAFAAQNKVRDEQIDKFKTLTNFSNFESQVNEDLVELKRNADPSGKGFTAAAEAAYKKRQDAFLMNEVPPELRDEFTFRASQVRNKVIADSAEFQYKAGDAYFKQGISDGYNKALQGVDPRTGGDPAALEDWKGRVFEQIDVSDLSEIEKKELKRNVARGLESASYRAELKDIYTVTNTPEGKRNARRQAISSIESGSREGNYNAVGPETSNGDRAYGRYQVMGNNVPAWTEEVLGRRMTPQEFLRDKKAQDAVFDYKFEQAAAKFGSDEHAASVWFTGQPISERSGAAADITGTTGNVYVDKFRKAMGGTVGEEIDSDPRFNNVAYEDRLAMRADVEREVLQDAADAQKAAQLATSAQLNSLLVRIHDGTAGQMEIDNARETWLTDYDAISKAENQLKERDKDVRVYNQAIQKVGDDGAIWDPTSDDDRKRQNAIVKQKDASGVSGLDRIGEMDQEYFTNGIVPLASRTGDIPTDVIGTLTGMVRSNQQTKALFALSALAQLEDADKRAFDFRVPEALAKDVELYRQYKDLLPEDQLMETINGGNTQQERQARKILQEEAKDYLQEKKSGVSTLSTLVDAVVGDLSPGWGTADRNAVPWAARALDAEFQTLFTDAYGRVGDVDKANTMATKALQKNWAVTTIGGRDVLMKYPPEKVGYKPIDGSYDWISRQVRSELDLPADSRFELISDEQTEKEFIRWQTQGGVPPSYQVVTFDGEDVGRLSTAESGLPARRYFQPTALDMQLEEQAYERKIAQEEMRRFINTYEDAQQLQMRMGVPIPEEIVEEKNRLDTIINSPVDKMLEGMESPVYAPGVVVPGAQ